MTTVLVHKHNSRERGRSKKTPRKQRWNKKFEL